MYIKIYHKIDSRKFHKKVAPRVDDSCTAEHSRAVDSLLDLGVG